MNNRTFIMIKPDAIEKELASTILNELQSHGCIVINQKDVIVTPSLILTHYDDVIKKVSIPNFKDRILKEFNRQVVTVAILTHPTKDVITYVRELIGATEPSKAEPDSLRGKYADDDFERAHQEERLVRNLIHASDSEESASIEIELWFKSTTL